MSLSGVIRTVKGLKFGGFDQQNNELFYQGVLGTTKYIFDTEACEKFFRFKFGTVIEFMPDPTSPGPMANTSSPTSSSLPSAVKQQTFKDFFGRFFLPLGVMISPAQEVPAGATATQEHENNGDDHNNNNSATHNEAGSTIQNHLSLFAVDIQDLTMINLVEATNDFILHGRYPFRVCENHDHGLFDSIPLNFPFGFSTTTLYGKYFVREGEHVYLANLQDSAQIVGEAFGCVWVSLQSKKGKIVPLPKATDESRLVTLYGLSDIENAPQPGHASFGQPAISPRQIQTPRGNSGSQNGPPFVLGKKTSDGKAAVLCNCPMSQQVLAICTQDALKEFEVRPMARIFFALGVDAGKSATILGVRNGSLYIHVDGAAKCVCLRNATNAKELKERYTGTDSAGTGAPTSHFISPAQTLPKKIDGPVAPPSTLPESSANFGSIQSGSIPRLSLNRLGSGLSNLTSGTSFNNNNNNNNNTRQISPSQLEAGRISPMARNSSTGNLSPSSPLPKGFYYWTSTGCLKFDISAEACSHFGVRHAQTHRFTCGPDAGQLFHVVGVNSGSLFVVQDHRQFALPLRYCQDEKDVKSRVGPSLISTTKLRSADPRGPAPSTQPLRSPERRAGSPFGLSPRNYQPENGDDVGNWGKAMPPRQRSEHDVNIVDRDIYLDASSPMNRAPSNNNFLSGVYEQQGVNSNSRLNVQKSMSPSLGAGSNNNNNLAAVTSMGKFTSSTSAVADTQQNPQQQMMATTEFSVSIGRHNRDLNVNKSTNSHPLAPTTANSEKVVAGAAGAAATDRGSSVGGESATTSHNNNNSSHDSVVRHSKIQPPRPVRHEALKSGNMPATRMYLKAIALRALGVKREAEMPTAFFRFFSHDAGQNLSRALKELPKFQNYWEQRERPMRGGRSFHEATTDMMVEALENLAQLRGVN